MIRVAVLVHHRLYIETIKQVIEKQPGMTAVSGLAYWEDFPSAARRADVYVVLYLPALEMMNAVARRIRSESPDTRIIFAGAPDDPDIMNSHFAAGISGFIRRSDGVDALVRAIALAAEGVVAVPDPGALPEAASPGHNLCEGLSPHQRSVRAKSDL